MADWGFIAGYLRSLKKDLLDGPALFRLIDASNELSFLKAVEDSAYGEYFTAGNIAHYDDIFEKYMQDLLAGLEKLVPDSPLLRLQHLSYDLSNMKIVYKTKSRGESMRWESLSENGTIEPEELYTIIEDKTYFKLHPSFDQAFKELDENSKMFADDQIVDFRLDQAAMEYKWHTLSEDAEYRALLPYLSAIADMENIKNTLRAKKLGIERTLFHYILLSHGTIPVDRFEMYFGSSLTDIAESIKNSLYGPDLADGLDAAVSGEGFSLLERQMDLYLLKTISGFQFAASGPRVLAEFLELKKMEIKNLTILFIGKLNNLAADQIKTRLRTNAI